MAYRSKQQDLIDSLTRIPQQYYARWYHDSIRSSHESERKSIAAMEDLSRLAYESLANSPQFLQFLMDTLQETRSLDDEEKESSSPLAKAHSKRSQTSNEQIRVWLILVSLLIAFFSAIQSGRPVEIDADQLTQIVRDKSSATAQIPAPTYLVQRPSVLKARPKSRAEAVHGLASKDTVRLLQRQHKWVFVESLDQATNSPVYGWTLKKYLRRLPAGQSTSSKELPNPGPKPANSLTREEKLAITDNWAGTNARRVELINKQIEASINEQETRELENLQRLADERIRMFAPLPIKNLESALEEIRREG